MTSKPEPRMGLWLTGSLALHVGLITAWWATTGDYSTRTVEISAVNNEVKPSTPKPLPTKIPTATEGGKVLANVVTKPLAQAIKDLPSSQREVILHEVAKVLDILAHDKSPSDVAAVTPSTIQTWHGGVLIGQIVQAVLNHGNQQVADALVTELGAETKTRAADAVGAPSPGSGNQSTLTSTDAPLALTTTALAPSEGQIGNTSVAQQTHSSSVKLDVRKYSAGVNRSDGGRDATQGKQGRTWEGDQQRGGTTLSPPAERLNVPQAQAPTGKAAGSHEMPVGVTKRAGGMAVKNQGGVQTNEAYPKLAAQVTHRGLQAGSSWIQPRIEIPLTDPVVESGLIPTHVMGGSEVIAVPLGPLQPFKPDFPTLAFQAIPFLPSGFTLDGLAQKWTMVPRLVMHPEWGTDDSEQVLQMGWRRDGLYVRCDVSDPDHQIRHAQATRFWEGDNIEVWFDGQNLKRPYRSRATGQHFWMWPEGAENNANQIGGEARIEQRGGGVEVFPLTKDRLTRSALRTPTGWTVEFRLDKSILIDATLEPGRIIGFNAYLNTLAGTNWYWSAGKKANTWYQPDTWGDMLLAGSDATLKRDDVLTEDQYPPLVAGQPVRLRVTDADMDLDPTRPDQVTVTLQSDHGGTHQVTLVESGNSTGIFLGGMATTPALDEDPPGLLGVNPGEHIRVTYVDQVRSDGARNTAIAMILRVGSSVLMGDIDRP